MEVSVCCLQGVVPSSGTTRQQHTNPCNLISTSPRIKTSQVNEEILCTSLDAQKYFSDTSTIIVLPTASFVLAMPASEFRAHRQEASQPGRYAHLRDVRSGDLDYSISFISSLPGVEQSEIEFLLMVSGGSGEFQHQ